VFFFILSILVLNSLPLEAGAFLFGKKVKADEVETIEEATPNHLNSQNMPLLEITSNPNLDNKESENTLIVQDDSFIYNNMPFWIENLETEKSSLSEKIIVYTVKEGDTLSEIAELFDVSTNTIRWENNISGEKIMVGQKLNILPVTGVKHIVKKGDTVSKIANNYDAESEDVFIFNDISKESILNVGDVVFVPNGIIKQVSNSKSSSGVKSSNTKVDTGYYARPIAGGRVTSPYGSRKGGFHYGVDLAVDGRTGHPIMASANGEVIKVVSGCKVGNTSCGGRYGNYIVIKHNNGTKTIYAHLEKVQVSVGDKVNQGEKIGTLGNTGRSTGPHLHFEIENANGSKMKPPF
jgi:murein DD-endopeptidase MepM/ murein hydrolase activator NlpD